MGSNAAFFDEAELEVGGERMAVFGGKGVNVCVWAIAAVALAIRLAQRAPIR